IEIHGTRHVSLGPGRRRSDVEHHDPLCLNQRMKISWRDRIQPHETGYHARAPGLSDTWRARIREWTVRLSAGPPDVNVPRVPKEDYQQRSTEERNGEYPGTRHGGEKPGHCVAHSSQNQRPAGEATKALFSSRIAPHAREWYQRLRYRVCVQHYHGAQHHSE